MKVNMYSHARKYFPFIFLLLITISSFSLTALASIKERDDGLIISEMDFLPAGDNFEYVTMILKTGYAHEPSEKWGVNNLTNELVYMLLRGTCALNVNYYPFPDYTAFTFVVRRDDFRDFCAEIDTLIRLDTLLLYELCNELINQHSHTGISSAEQGQHNLYELFYGTDHPYLNKFKANYSRLNINTVNNWFREIYKPNNIIISTTAKLPADFLKKPNGRDMQKKVNVPKISRVFPENSNYTFTEVHDNVSTVYLGFPGPKPNEDGFFPGLIVQKYLQHKLWLKLRQELGFCYDVQVNYSYLTEPAAPTLTVVFQALPENTEQALCEVFCLIKNMEQEKLSPEEINYFVEREKKYKTKNYSSRSFLSMMDAIGAHLNLEWAADYERYISELQKVSADDILIFSQTHLKKWRLSVVGPAIVGEFFTYYENPAENSRRQTDE